MSDELPDELPPRVTISWLDTVGEPGWRPRARIEHEAEHEDLVHYSCGFLIDDKPDYVQLALSWRGESEWTPEMFSDTLTIPRSAITDGPHELR